MKWKNGKSKCGYYSCRVEPITDKDKKIIYWVSEISLNGEVLLYESNDTEKSAKLLVHNWLLNKIKKMSSELFECFMKNDLED